MGTAQRYKTSEIAKIQVYGRSGDLVARLKNISAQGALLELLNGDFLPKRGDFIHITIHLSDVNKTHEINGQVIWSNELSFGIYFIKKQELADFILRSVSGLQT
jgi:hypothetical protein